MIVWGNSNMLLLLWLLPLVALVLVYAHRKRVRAAHRFADHMMVSRLMPSFRATRQWVKGVILIAALACMIVAAARPRFGVYFEQVTQRGADLFVLLDVSKSMLAEDVAPNRMERAKSDIRDLMTRLKGDRIGLIAFAGRPVVKVPLTTDHGFYQLVLDQIDTTSAPRGGSLIGDAIRKALEAMPQAIDRDQVLVLITDGEDHDSYPEEAAKAAADRNVKIITVGLGDTSDGARIPVRDEHGNLTYVQKDGQVIWSRMDENLLKSIALTTSGAYVPARTTVYDLGNIYEEHLADLTRSELQSDKRKRYREQYQLFLAIGLALLLFEMLVRPYPAREEGGLG